MLIYFQVTKSVYVSVCVCVSGVFFVTIYSFNEFLNWFVVDVVNFYNSHLSTRVSYAYFFLSFLSSSSIFKTNIYLRTVRLKCMYKADIIFFLN